MAEVVGGGKKILPPDDPHHDADYDFAEQAQGQPWEEEDVFGGCCKSYMCGNASSTN